METSKLKEMIEAGLPGSEVEALDTHGSGDHFEVTVVSDLFDGKSLVARHRLVYDALGDAMRSEIHALTIRALSPQQYRDGLVRVG